MRAVGNNVILLKDPEPKERSGILLPEDMDPTADSKKGTVTSIGVGRMNAKTGKRTPIDPMIEKGARVVYINRTVIKNTKKYNSNEWVDGENTYVHVDAGDIVGIL